MTKRYEKYKPSGIEWIEEIPEHWKTEKVKYCSSINDETLPETTDDDFEINYVDISSIQNGEIADITVYRFENAPSRARRKVQHGDIIVSTVRTYLKAIARIKNPINNLIVSTGFAVIRPKNIQSDFLSSVFVSEYVINEIISRSVGVSYPAINSSEIGEIRIPVPPEEEQLPIANYLNEKKAQIDKLITNKKQIIDLLKEERTAIIDKAVSGEGKNWEKKKLKYCVSKVGSGITPKGGANVYQSQGIPLLRSQNIYNDGLVLDDVAFISEDIDEEMSNTRVREGDVLLNITGASIGRCYFIPEGFGRGNVNQHVCIIRPDPLKLTTEYLHYFLISGIGQNLIDECQNGANREGLNFQQIKSFIILLPGLNEQTEIVQQILTEQSKIYQVINKIETEIQLLKEYRTALINEIITGKQKVN